MCLHVQYVIVCLLSMLYPIPEKITLASAEIEREK